MQRRCVILSSIFGTKQLRTSTSPKNAVAKKTVRYASALATLYARNPAVVIWSVIPGTAANTFGVPTVITAMKSATDVAGSSAPTRANGIYTGIVFDSWLLRATAYGHRVRRN